MNAKSCLSALLLCLTACSISHTPAPDARSKARDCVDGRVEIELRVGLGDVSWSAPYVPLGEGPAGNGLFVRVSEGWEAPSYAGAATFNGTTSRAGQTLAHEIGHIVGLAHDTVDYPGIAVP